jgi:hypothetical protein
MRCGHEHDDGAYVLGSLSPSERASYERHLATCSFCREAVADIAVLPGLLGRLDPDDFAKLLDPTLTAPPTQRNRMPALVTAAQTTRRQERVRGRRQLIGAALAAACLALVAGIGAVLWLDTDPPAATAPVPVTVAMQPVAEQVKLAAGVHLTDTQWGTTVYMVCRYDKDAPSPKSYTFRLMAYGPDDEVEQVGSWVAAPGAEVKMTGMTRFSGGSLDRLELINFENKALLSYDVP